MLQVLQPGTWFQVQALVKVQVVNAMSVNVMSSGGI